MNDITEATLKMVESLEEVGADYLVVGALAAANYGLTRSTMDADFVVVLKAHKLSEIVRRMGSAYQLDPQPGFELFTSRRIDVIHVIGTPFKIDVFGLADDPFDREQFQRRRKGLVSGRGVVLPTAEDVIVQKLRWSRPKDWEDARDVMAVQGDALDWAYIERWCEQHGTRETLDRLRGEIPPL